MTAITKSNDLAPQTGAEPVEAWRANREVVNTYEAFWARQHKRVLGGCADDRGITELSATTLAGEFPEAQPASEAFASIFGGQVGAAKAILLTGIAQYGPEFVEAVGGWEGMLGMVDELFAADKSDQAITPALHTAEGNENPDGTFCEHGDNAIGCAYCGGVGATSALLTDESDPLIRDTAREHQKYLFGNDEHFDDLVQAEVVFKDVVAGDQGAQFAVGRQDFIKSKAKGVPIMILAGNHTPAAKTVVINNFELGTIGSANQAKAAGKPMYRQDIAQWSAAIIRNFRELELDPELLVRAIVLEATPVHAVLAAHDADPELHGKLDPRNLRIGFRGDARQLIEQLRQMA